MEAARRPWDRSRSSCRCGDRPARSCCLLTACSLKHTDIADLAAAATAMDVVSDDVWALRFVRVEPRGRRSVDLDHEFSVGWHRPHFALGSADSTLTPCQNATRSLIRAAAGLGSG